MSIQLGLTQRSARSVRLGAVALLALLAGCDGKVTMDMATEYPSDPNINQVVAKIRGLEFTGSSGTKTLEFTDPLSLDFLDYTNDNNLLRLFTSEKLADGTYTGVRLLMDTDQSNSEAFVTVSGSTRQFPMNIAQGDYASLSLKVKKNDNSSDAYTLMLDLRQSLAFDNDKKEYTFTPVLRAVRSKDVSSIQGTLTVTCSAGDSLSEGAVYLFQGKNITPDDLDGSGVEPFATSPVFGNSNSSLTYSLRVLPAGDYTMAVTCRGNDDDPATNEDLAFRNIVNVSLDDKQTLTRNLP